MDAFCGGPNATVQWWQISCHYDIAIVVSAAFYMHAVFAVLVYTCCSSSTKHNANNEDNNKSGAVVVSHFLPCHSVRWLLTFFLFLATLADVGDALLAQVSKPYQPLHVLVSAGVCLVASCVVFLWYQRVEIWGKPVFVVVSEVFFVCSAVTRAGKIWHLLDVGINFQYVRLHINIVLAFLYTGLGLLDGWLLLKHVSIIYQYCQILVLTFASEDRSIISNFGFTIMTIEKRRTSY